MTFFALSAAARERFGVDRVKANASALMELIASRSASVRDAAGLISARGRETDFDAAKLLDDFGGYLDGKPLAYLTGQTDFCGLRLRVRPGTLAPRPETQEVAEAFLRAVRNRDLTDARVLDLCTGGGCLALAIGAALPFVPVVGIDSSPEAVALANENRDLLGLKDVSFSRMDFADALRAHAPQTSLVVCNPPYVDAADPDLDPDVVRHEPKAAVIAPDGGYFFYEAFADFAERSGWLPDVVCFEIGASQGARLSSRFSRPHWRAYNLRALPDAFGRTRVLQLIRRKGR